MVDDITANLAKPTECRAPGPLLQAEDSGGVAACPCGLTVVTNVPAGGDVDSGRGCAYWGTSYMGICTFCSMLFEPKLS